MLDSLRCNDGVRTRLAAATRRPRGFTLIELIVVMVIIGIIIVFMLNASWAALRSSQEKATQGLIAKLDAALSDRVDAILQTRVGTPTPTQVIVAQLYDGVTQFYWDPNWYGWDARTSMKPWSLERAYVLAQVELLQRELPDVFYVQNPATYGYPLNFAANPYPLTSGSPNMITNGPDPDAAYVLPLGTGWPYNAAVKANYFNPGQGIYGASYQVAAGIYKNLGYLPAGFDGVDNNGNGRIDEWSEGVTAGVNDSLVQSNLAAHTHKTARAEMLYALLVESVGPFGSIFNRDDFTDNEVKDTDGDGLPEFVDAWGEPLQFYRWPLLYHSELQRGLRTVSGSTGAPVLGAPYDGMIGAREQDAVDPNQTLMSPSWWYGPYNSVANVPPLPQGFSVGAGNWSPAVSFFENYFHLLHEPLFNSSTPPALGQFWDRGAGAGGPFGARRAFSSKFLILSSGPDLLPGVFQYSDAALQSDLGTAAGTPNSRSFPLIGLENLAAQLNYLDLTKVVSGGASLGYPLDPLLQSPVPSPIPYPSSLDIQAQGQDDVTNHYVPAGGIGGSAP